jgi:uncharacterized membrane protein
MIYGVSYLACLLVFGAIDAVWISTMASRLYRPILGDILLADLRVAPALVFYFLFPIGLLIFAVFPSLRNDSWTTAAIYGLLFGAFTYGTYDLTNYATMRNWNLQITVIDIVYGAVVAAIASTAAYAAARAMGGASL